MTQSHEGLSPDFLFNKKYITLRYSDVINGANFPRVTKQRLVGLVDQFFTLGWEYPLSNLRRREYQLSPLSCRSLQRLFFIDAIHKRVYFYISFSLQQKGSLKNGNVTQDKEKPFVEIHFCDEGWLRKIFFPDWLPDLPTIELLTSAGRHWDAVLSSTASMSCSL